MRLDIEHRLGLHYDAYIAASFLELRVEPQSSEHQTLRSFYLAVGPPTRVSRYFDWNGNAVHHFGISGFHDRIEVTTRSRVETHPAHPSPETLTDPPPGANGEELGPLAEWTAFGGPVLRSEALDRLSAELAAPPGAALGEQILALGTLMRERFEYSTEVTDYQSTSDHILEEGGGVCQDFAHLALALLRHRGIPCRYVSGYLHVERDERAPSQSHAWIEVAAPDGRWAAFDPTHDGVPGERYVAVARGRHYDDVPPNRGLFIGNAVESLVAEVHTARVEHASVAALEREVGRIDLPVFRELRDVPGNLRPGAVDEQRGADEQQQQQQQQQQLGRPG